MSGHADPHANAPTTCRNDEPGCVGPNGFDMTTEHYYYVCQACVAEASGRCTGGDC